VCFSLGVFFFRSTYPKTAATYGLPFDSTQSVAQARMSYLHPENSGRKKHVDFFLVDWTLLSASSVFNATTSSGRDSLFSMVHSRSFLQSGDTPNPATYSPIDGTHPRGAASPAMGAVYSLLSLTYVLFFSP